ncbi:hypothetical protein QYE76_008782 [Lolium multiflorum]|uniref:Uncharacterized protein n=1 Tax=Lolium multiflorum TaxID=4521 RepID=A0AAD8TTZ9_LOLMU|nr:hypothetical protein QYE76_008782 [Lolium multiflorum]
MRAPVQVDMRWNSPGENLAGPVSERKTKARVEDLACQKNFVRDTERSSDVQVVGRIWLLTALQTQMQTCDVLIQRRRTISIPNNKGKSVSVMVVAASDEHSVTMQCLR